MLDAEDQVVGIISERDVVHALAEHGESVLGRQVRDLMTEHVFVCKPEDTIKEVMTWMTRHRARHLPVVQDDRLHGLISIGDVVKHRLDEIQTEANVLRDIVISRP